MSRKRVLAAMAAALGAGAWLTRRVWLARVLGLPPPANSVSVDSTLVIPMPDGVCLRADHYAPRAAGAFPTLLIRTPYGRNLRAGVFGHVHAFIAQRLAERGYHVVVQDVRGRFDSGGEFALLEHEQRDGLSTLEWIMRQAWCDGRLGMWGHSYEGYAEWAVAADAPDALRALLISCAGSQIVLYRGTAFALEGMIRWMLTLAPGRGSRARLSQELAVLNAEVQSRVVRRVMRHLPIGEIDVQAGGAPVPYYRKLLQPANESETAPFWQALHHGLHPDRIRARMTLVAGWYDVFLNQMLDDYTALCAAGQAPRLTIGPWEHDDAGAMFEGLRAGLELFDLRLKGRAPRPCDGPVRLYLMGTRQWRACDAWPPATVAVRYFLNSLHRLSAERPAERSEPDCYRYDPADPTPSFGGERYDTFAGAFKTKVLEARADIVAYTGPPLGAACDVIGYPRLDLFAGSSIRHVDFFVRLCDVYPGGESFNVCDGFVRLGPADGEWQADGTRRVTIRFTPTAQRFGIGHRIRLLIASGAHPRWARNLGTGEPAAHATRMLPAEIAIYHDLSHTSVLELPCVP